LRIPLPNQPRPRRRRRRDELRYLPLLRPRWQPGGLEEMVGTVEHCWETAIEDGGRMTLRLWGKGSRWCWLERVAEILDGLSSALHVVDSGEVWVIVELVAPAQIGRATVGGSAA